jgi:hypothetical protein
LATFSWFILLSTTTSKKCDKLQKFHIHFIHSLHIERSKASSRIKNFWVRRKIFLKAFKISWEFQKVFNLR